MKEHDTAQGLITVGQMKEIGSAVFQSIPTNLSFRTAEEWKGNKDYLSNQLKKLLREGVPDLVAWQKFFKKYFGKDLNLSILQIPPKQEGFDRVIIIPKGITIGQVYEVCSKNFPCWKWTEDLIGAASQNDRSSEKESYVIRVRERQEADEENVNLSAEQVQKRNIKGITLLERLILELKYWDETSNHLDVSNLTLCTGSRYSDGHVPYVDWRGSCLYVSWCNPQDAYSCWRARTVVSF